MSVETRALDRAPTPTVPGADAGRASLAPGPTLPDEPDACPCALCWSGAEADTEGADCAEPVEEEGRDPVDDDELAAWEQYGRDMEAALRG